MDYSDFLNKLIYASRSLFRQNIFLTNIKFDCCGDFRFEINRTLDVVKKSSLTYVKDLFYPVYFKKKQSPKKRK